MILLTDIGTSIVPKEITFPLLKTIRYYLAINVLSLIDLSILVRVINWGSPTVDIPTVPISNIIPWKIPTK